MSELNESVMFIKNIPTGLSDDDKFELSKDIMFICKRYNICVIFDSKLEAPPPPPPPPPPKKIIKCNGIFGSYETKESIEAGNTYMSLKKSRD